MEKGNDPELQALLGHIMKFIDAVPEASDQTVNWSELQSLRNSAMDSLQRLQDFAGPLETVMSGHKCPGALPKQ